MSLSQAKIDLAVLYKLHRHADANGGAITANDVHSLFQFQIPQRRVALALEELEKKQYVEKVYHPLYHEVGLWEISRRGIGKVDQAITVANSFLGKLHRNGEAWLQSDEAVGHELKKGQTMDDKDEVLNQAFEEADRAREMEEGTFSLPLPPEAEVSSAIVEVEQKNPIDWPKWGSIAGVIGVPLAILLWYFS